MSEDETFLERWSRRKRESSQRSESVSETPQAPAGDADRRDEAGAESAAPADESIDLSSLPPLESITAETDIRAYMSRGVPEELRREALRRAWAADPTIRDFIGLQENDWDFNDPNAIPGFGRLVPGEDLRRLVADVVRGVGESAAEPATGERKQPVEALPQSSGAESQMMPAAETTLAAPGDQSPSAEWNAADVPDSVVRRNSGDADIPTSAPTNDPNLARPRRRHGGALPKV